MYKKGKKENIFRLTNRLGKSLRPRNSINNDNRFMLSFLELMYTKAPGMGKYERMHDEVPDYDQYSRRNSADNRHY